MAKAEKGPAYRPDLYALDVMAWRNDVHACWQRQKNGPGGQRLKAAGWKCVNVRQNPTPDTGWQPPDARWVRSQSLNDDGHREWFPYDKALVELDRREMEAAQMPLFEEV